MQNLDMDCVNLFWQALDVTLKDIRQEQWKFPGSVPTDSATGLNIHNVFWGFNLD